MSEMTLVFTQQIVKMFLMVLIGYGAVKLGLMPATAGKGLSQVSVAIIRPCAIIAAFQVAFSRERLLGLCLAIFAAALTHVVLIGLIWLMNRGKERFTPIEQLSMTYSNSGNLLMPLIAASMGQEWIFYTCAYIAVVQVFVWTHGKSVACREPQIDWKKALGNINILAMVIGLIFFCTSFTIPGPLGLAVDNLGDALGAASMLTIGVSFATLKGLDLKKFSKVLAVTGFRLILSPLLMLAIFLALRLHTLLPDAEQILLITILGVGAPTAVVVTQLAQLYDQEVDHASLLGVVTMLCSLVTLPTLIWVYETAVSLF